MMVIKFIVIEIIIVIDEIFYLYIIFRIGYI